jgi:hypothetical protein
MQFNACMLRSQELKSVFQYSLIGSTYPGYSNDYLYFMCFIREPLLVLTSLYQLLFIKNIIYLINKTIYLNEDGNCTEHTPSLSSPCFYQRISYIVFRLVNILHSYKMKQVFFLGYVILLFTLGFKAPLKMPFLCKISSFFVD